MTLAIAFVPLMAIVPGQEVLGDIITETGRTGGWAAVLLAVMIVTAGYFTYLLARYTITKAQEQSHKDMEELRADYTAQLERERFVTDRYDTTLQSVNTTFGEVGEVIRQNTVSQERTNTLQERTTAALDRNSDLLERLTPQRPRQPWGESEGHW